MNVHTEAALAKEFRHALHLIQLATDCDPTKLSREELLFKINEVQITVKAALSLDPPEGVSYHEVTKASDL